jgi:hypothetical protein
MDFQAVEKRPAMVIFRVTLSERRRLEHEATARGLSISELTRRALGMFLQQEEESEREKWTRP